MPKLTRWQALVALLAGAYAALSPLWTDTDDMATWTMVVLGVATMAVSLWSVAMPDDKISEYALVLMGVLFIVAPWVMGFANIDDMALTAWIVGAITLVAGVLEVPQIEHRLHLHHGPIAH
ncbi:MULTISPECIES: SPW repeat protein [unclassified Nocardioides]|uniref:SPW repeat protein n=1 Tax=unclassified Nocardioides TaxID=2615069 RepID=UPI0006F44A06|nr:MULTISPECIES: SPW repeat protein [unclassified Nocardioides]KQY62451.1 hypothetical protein ASD30_24085 [Nocardioides sp. Root140]KQZ70598.1 hypothetical protein ASD66_13505 [Nocardioides sp. Root151]KRF16903.1 hypothetical protein ASH02_02250 [Nocardioides sp. Soil796]